MMLFPLLPRALHTQLYPPALRIYADHAHLHDLPNSDDRERVAHEAIGKLGDMHQAILLDADIDERAEVYHVAHGSLQDHAGREVFYLQHVVAQDGRGQRVTRVEAGFFQVVENVVERGQADADLLRDIDPGRLLAITIGRAMAVGATEAALQLDELAELRHALGWFRLLTAGVVGGGQHGEQGTRSGIAFGVDEGIVERLAAVGDLEKACRLHEGGRAKPWNLLQLLTRVEAAMLLAVLDDSSRHARVNARHMLEQRGGSGIDLDPREVDAGDHHAVEHVGQRLLIDIMLVEADADGFRVDLDQLGQRVLQAARNGDRAALGRIKRRKFLTRRFRGRIDRRARLVDNHIADLHLPALLAALLLKLPDKRGDELLGLARSRAVADGDHINGVLCQQTAQSALCLLE